MGQAPEDGQDLLRRDVHKHTGLIHLLQQLSVEKTVVECDRPNLRIAFQGLSGLHPHCMGVLVVRFVDPIHTHTHTHRARGIFDTGSNTTWLTLLYLTSCTVKTRYGYSPMTPSEFANSSIAHVHTEEIPHE
jgi:hypothetical protein